MICERQEVPGHRDDFRKEGLPGAGVRPVELDTPFAALLRLPDIGAQVVGGGLVYYGLAWYPPARGGLPLGGRLSPAPV